VTAVERKKATGVSKLLSLALRHDPSALGLELDPSGWVDVAQVLRGLAACGKAVAPEELMEIVRTSDKRRFALSSDGTRIRANQGHSLPVDLGLVPLVPPAVLYHGTVARFLGAIRMEGLVRGSRQQVHLSADRATAALVASRRRGPHVILEVGAGEMHSAGHVFFRSENGVWLTEHVPPNFLVIPD
jgi:putative RNA 2'-phosphotransferase